MKHLAYFASALLLLSCTGDPGGPPGAGGDGIDPVEIGGGDGGACAHPEAGCACDQIVPITCHLPATVVDDVLTCHAGTRYCREGAWSGCESVEDYELVTGPGIAPLVTGPSECNPCDPSCAVSRDIPSDADLPGSSTDISYDPGAGGISITPISTPPPPLPDSDGDGIPDIADDCVGPGAFRNADGTCYGDTFFFHELPFGGPAVIDPLDVNVQVRTADVYFLMDTTGSMGGELSNLQRDLTSGTFIAGCSDGIVGAIRCTIPDAWFGVGQHDDYPVSPYGSAGSGDIVYRNWQNITSSLAATQTAVNSLGLHYGMDGPESQSQALWAIATGGGLGSYLSPQTGCVGAEWGYPCFRDGTIPIVVLFTDAPFHNGPFGYAYSLGTVPVTWAEAVTALNANGIRIITVHSGGTYGITDANALADATGSYASSGARQVFPISSSGTGLSTAVVTAVEDLANYSRMDISARAVDDAATAIDERGFVDAIAAVGWGPGSCTGISGGSTFIQCLPGTSVDFNISFRNDIVMPTMVPQVFDFFIEVIGDGTFVLERIPVRIVVPPVVPLYPPSGEYWRDYDTTLYCASNERPDWGELDWEIASLPTGTSIRFEIRASDTLAGLPGATPVTFTVPSTLPTIDIAARLLGAGVPVGYPYLRVTAVLLANTALTLAPTLRSFEVRYNCIPEE